MGPLTSADVIEQARALGFERCAVLPASLTLDERPSLDRWLAERRHGVMDYLERGPSRTSTAPILAPARSLVVVAKNYKRPLDLLPGGLRIARYAHNLDYHDVLRERLEALARFIRERSGHDVDARAITDSAPLLERALAKHAGLGWVGKNTMLIDQQLGSFFLLAELLVDLDLEPTHPAPANDRCGRCTRCIDACPTGAITSPHTLDARRCISYLTIELKDPIPHELRPLIGDYLFGCDICQDVCPWNRKAPDTHDPDFLTREAYKALTPQDLLSLTRRDFNKIFAGSPIQRTRRQGLLRNAAVVLGNRADPEDIPLLKRRMAVELEPLVRGHIAWALSRIDHPEALAALELANKHEPDAYVQEELWLALERHPRQTADSLLQLHRANLPGFYFPDQA
ncbi:MAG: tRNA epoxyqueuosine(34) reductase QueG [Myxococcota bacterium]|nr:tRNA epoxyqueuosine(34) reductase QueG [Myxococcota bacterium]